MGKTLHLRAALLAIVAAAASYAMADTYNYSFQSQVFKEQGTQTLNEKSWKLETDAGYFGYSSDKGQQIGSGKNPAKSLTLSTADISGTITSITVNTSGASSTNATLTVSVGGQTFGKSYSLTSTATDATFSGSASGEIKLSYSQTSSKAIYIKSIAVEYSSGSMPPTPTPSVAYAESFAELKALEDGTEVSLYLSDENNARVTYVNGNRAFLRDATGAVCFSGFENILKLVYNQHLAGYIQGKKTTVDRITTFVPTSKTNASLLAVAEPVTEENVKPKVIAASELENHLGDWVAIADAKVTTDGYAESSTGSVKVVNTFNTSQYEQPAEGNTVNFSGIANYSPADGVILSPIYNQAVKRAGNPTSGMEMAFPPTPISLGIAGVKTTDASANTTIYNMVGQRMSPSQAQKGVFIVNGRKVIR